MEEKKIAILIDAENVSYKNATQIMETMATKGTIAVKTIVADWTKITGAKKVMSGRCFQTEGWRKEANKHSMTAIQAFSYVSGKNTSDITLTIIAMKILFEKPFVNTFCLVSNDSDFTRLAQELRENNKEIIGMGDRNKAIQEFVNAFSEFIYLGESMDDSDKEEFSQNLVTECINVDIDKNDIPISKPVKAKKTQGKKAIKNKSIIPDEQLKTLIDIIETAIEDTQGSALYSVIASKMKKQYSDFVPENYECKNTSALIRKILPAIPQYVEHSESIANNPNGFIMMLKRK
ncbi:MAG: NYN domain-containing protein [Clostridia bacterium]|nr:NYN domain-containing protein [Clostridia bacterium]